MQINSQVHPDTRSAKADSGHLVSGAHPQAAARGPGTAGAREEDRHRGPVRVDAQSRGAASDLSARDAHEVRVRRGRTFTYPPQSLIDEIVILWRDRIRAQQVETDASRYLLSRCREICRVDHLDEWTACIVDQAAKTMPKLNKDARKLRAQMISKRALKEPHPRLAQTAAIDPDFAQWREIARRKVSEIEKRMRPLADRLPVWSDWAKHVPGLGAVSVVGIIAECPHISDLISYDEKRARHAGNSSAGGWTGPYKMNKRFGLAVVDGKRQRNTREQGQEGDGYAPRRKSLLWNCARTLVQNESPYLPVYCREWRKWTEKEAGGPVLKSGAPDWAWGMTDSATKGRPNRYNHALGVVSKQMLIDLWRVWHGFGCRSNYQP